MDGLVIDELPFFYKSHANPGNGNRQSHLPFDLYYDSNLCLVRQRPFDGLEKILSEVYLEGSLADGSLSNESGEVYVNAIIQYLKKHAELTTDSSVLEIGFGSGRLLKELKNLNVENLTGIEPGQHKLINGLEGIRLIQDFFPSPNYHQKADIIFSFAILEHIEDPLAFIIAQKEALTANGKIVVGVPNCETYLNEGDISCLIHEHYSYFTSEAMIKLAELAGLCVEDVSIIEGALFATYSLNDKSSFKLVSLGFDPNHFVPKVNKHIEVLKAWLINFAPDDLAIYAPIRAMNLLSVAGLTDFRLIDDSSELEGKYLPGLSKPIESLEMVLKRPPRSILIFSRTFGERIRSRIEGLKELENTSIHVINEFID